MLQSSLKIGCRKETPSFQPLIHWFENLSSVVPQVYVDAVAANLN